MPKHQIKGLTLHGPWTHAILYAGKDIENRDYPCYLKIGDYIALHAGKTYDWQGAISIGLITRELGRPYTPPVEQDYKAGFIYGVAQFAGNVEDSDSPWFFGDYGWQLTNVVAIEPVVCRGKQGLFALDPVVLMMVRRNWKAATNPHHITQAMIYESIDAMDEAYADVGPTCAEDWGAL
jgi:hypothetical protein